MNWLGNEVTKMTMKKSKIIVITVAIIVISMILTIVMNMRASSDKEETVEHVELFTDLGEIQAFRVLANEKVEATKIKNSWEVDGIEQKLEAEKLDALIHTIRNLKGKEVAIARKDVHLDFPNVTVELTDDDGSTESFSVGQLNNNQTKYYVEHRETQTIYLVDRQYIETIPLKPSDLMDQGLVTIPINELVEIVIFNGTEEIVLKRDAPYTEEEKIAHISGWYMWKPYEGIYSVTFQAMEEIYQGIPELKLSNVVQDDTETGIEESDFHITFRSKTEEETLFIGNPAKNNHYYISREDHNETMTINTELLAPFSKQSFDMIDKFMHIVALEVTKDIKIKTSQKTYHLEIEQQNDGLAITLNNQEIEDNAFKKVYPYLAGLTFDTYVGNQTSSNNADIEIAYTIETEEKGELTERIALIPINNESYLIQKEMGASEFSIRKEKIEETLKQLDDLLK